MTSAMLADLLQSLGILGLFLIIGVIIRAKFTIFQKTFIPASVIGGFLLLILGPQVLNLLPVPADWFKIYSLIPGILIVPIVTAVPLGLKMDFKSDGKGNGTREVMKNIIPLAFIGLVASAAQFAIGFLTNVVFANSYDLYPNFGVELPVGFVGGHGTAGTLGNILQEMNVPYWETSQGVGITTATFGLVGGILIGITIINWAARKGHTVMLDKPADIPEDLRLGYQKDIDKQGSTGRETMLSSSVDTFAFHLSIIFFACLLAYAFVNLMKSMNVPILSSISVWAYGMIAMFLLWFLIQGVHADSLVDDKVKGKITGAMTDFAVIGAVASLPLQAVASYIVPILVMVVIGYIVTTGLLFLLMKYCIKGYWVEHLVSVLGMATGVFLTGVLLLRICDPDLKSPVLTNYSLSYTVTSLVFFAALNMFIVLPMTKGALFTGLLALGIMVVSIIATIVSSRLLFGNTIHGNPPRESGAHAE
ncbi:MAG: sodium/glutamate symporter [Peptoniphilaceae bacterium]|nr:sodium/glutamate symporter [Peptoniphilaceae bacterium]MDY6086228.1 sodium/glutamate symporter [Peptoniphilaceae bacterium]